MNTNKTPLPVLYLQSSNEQEWTLVATVIGNQLPKFAVETGIDKQWTVWEMGEEKLHAFQFRFPRGKTSEYSCNDRKYRVVVPNFAEKIRLSLSACNGYEAEDLDNPEENRSQAWAKMFKKHRENPYHLMLQMGDQIYNDKVWVCHPELEGWRDYFPLTRYKYPFSEEMLKATEQFYWDHYSSQRLLPNQSELQAEIPSLMMWDDHDIFDGYGSYRGYDSHSEVFQGVFSVAKQAFEAFQTPQFNWEFHAGTYVEIDQLGILIPDLRSLRTRRNVMGARGLTFLKESLEKAQNCKQLLVVMTVPFVNTSLNLIERIMVLIPGQQLYQDDLRDQWRSYAHIDEWKQVADMLFDFESRSGCKVHLFSGEIHLAAKGKVSKGNQEITQYITSGVAHPPPPQKLIRFLNMIASRNERIGDYRIEMQKMDQESFYQAENGFLQVGYESQNLEVNYEFVPNNWS